jgi:nitroreductase
MNDILNSIKARRSVRNYRQQEIPEEIINRIIEAGNDAPSGMNSQPWRFVIVRSSKIREKMMESVK